MQLPHYARHFEAMGVDPGSIGVAGEPAELPVGLAAYDALDVAVVRVLSERTLEDVLAKRPVIKKVEGERIFFYPPTFRLHSMSPPSPEWAYALYGIRAYAPTQSWFRADWLMFDAKPHQIEARVKIKTPARKARRRP